MVWGGRWAPVPARLVMAALVLLLAAGAWTVSAGLAPCRWLDRLLGASGCAEAWRLEDLTRLRQGLAFRPGTHATLVVAGVARGGVARLVLYDLGQGEETARYLPDPGGVIETVALSPDGRHAALTCNRRHACDLAPMRVPPGIDRDDFAPIGLIDLERWSAARRSGLRSAPEAGWRLLALPGQASPADADGAALAPRFSADGATLVAGEAAWSVADGAPAAPPAGLPPERQGRDRLRADAAEIRHEDGVLLLRDAGGERRIALDLPPGFIPELHLPLALSPDGQVVAALSRRFAGIAAPGAVLQAWRLSDGARLLRREIETPLFAPLVFTPDGAALLLAAPDGPRDSELRRYALPGAAS
jgi:hypothetical protein